MLYAFTENFVLPLSHDEVVHMKGSLISKMPGDDRQKAANLRAMFTYMYTQPGKKLMFMGGEFGQWREWNHDSSLDWDATQHEFHATIQRFSADLNHLYASEPALYELDTDPAGFEWVDANDSDSSSITYMRRGRETADVLIAINFTPIVRYNYRVGVPGAGIWREVLNSDATQYGGSGQGNMGGMTTTPIPLHGRPYSLNLTLPPLGAVILRHEGSTD
jgi:1,4-alpha-glucan branching enzyme